MASANTRYPRFLKRNLLEDLNLYPVVGVMGARQVGKSTLCLELAEELGLARRTLDDRDVREQALADPEGFLAGLGDNGAFIDEAQRAPDLFLAIKAIVDREGRPGRYLLSGSNQPRMGRVIGDSLVGRATYRTLYPLTLSELRFDEEYRGWSFLLENDDASVVRELKERAALSGELDWRQIVQTGGFPRAVAAPPEQRLRVLDDYVEVFSSRDIRELIAVESTARLEAFVRLTAARTGQQLNASDLARDLGVPVTTIRRWLEVLERSYLIGMVPPYSRNASARVIKSPKLFMVDPALAMAAAREREPTGFHLETLVYSDLQVWKGGGPLREVYHWRLASGQEVDFVLEERGRLLPLEVKAANSIGVREARHLLAFRELHANAPRGLLLSCDREIRILAPGIVACPWWAML